MSWVCPKCKRAFKHANQEHSCHIVSLEHHFEDKPPEIKATFDTLIRELKNFGEIKVSSVKHSILLKAETTFLAIKPKKRQLDIEFILPKEINDFGILKTMRYSTNRVAHFTVLESPSDVNRQLLKWLKQSYGLVKKKTKTKGGADVSLTVGTQRRDSNRANPESNCTRWLRCSSRL